MSKISITFISFSIKNEYIKEFKLNNKKNGGIDNRTYESYPNQEAIY